MSETVPNTALPGTNSVPGARLGLDKFDLAVLLLLVATYVLVAMLPFGPKKFGDWFFHEEAKDLSLAVRGAGSWHNVSINHAPAPVFYYAIPYLVVPAGASNNTYWLAAFSWNILWMAVSLLLIRRCGELLGGTLTGKMAAALSLLSPFSVYYSYGVLAESVGYLGVVLFTYGFLAWKHTPRKLSKSRWYLFLFSAGLLTLVLSRPNAVLFLFFALVIGAILLRSKNDIKKLEGKFVLVSGFATLAMFTLVTLLLIHWSGGVSENPQNQNLGLVVMQGRFQFRTVLWDFRIWPDLPDNPDFIEFTRQRENFQRTALQTGRAFSSLQWHWIAKDFLHHPGITLRSAAIRFVDLHLSFLHSLEPEEFHFGFLKGRLGYALFHLAVNGCNMLMVIGSVLLLVTQRRNLLGYWILWGPWLALVLFHVATYAESRYLFPGRPCLILMAALALVPRLQGLLPTQPKTMTFVATSRL
jgi:hypothetical protein